MNMPEELLTKYHMKTMEGYKEDFEDSKDTEVMFWNTFLKQTDHIPNKLVEGAIRTEECAEELTYREIARCEIARLNGEEITGTQKHKTLEERATASENVSNALLGGYRDSLQAAEQHSKAIQMFAQTLPDEEALEIAAVYPAYIAGKSYKADEMFAYGENSVGDPQLYRVVQAHTSQEDWKPDTSPSLYTPIGLNDEGYPVWSQPTGAHDAYAAGDIVDYNGTLYRSVIDGNVYSPDAYPAGWEVYTE